MPAPTSRRTRLTDWIPWHRSGHVIRPRSTLSHVLENALARKAFGRAYSEWAYEYTLATTPMRVLRPALIPTQHPITGR